MIEKRERSLLHADQGMGFTHWDLSSAPSLFLMRGLWLAVGILVAVLGGEGLRFCLSLSLSLRDLRCCPRKLSCGCLHSYFELVFGCKN